MKGLKPTPLPPPCVIKICATNAQVVLPQSYSFFLPFFSQSEERFYLLHIFYIACYINKKEFITEDMYSLVHISVFISTTIATTRALIRVNET